jgi:hypothetical protein
MFQLCLSQSTKDLADADIESLFKACIIAAWLDAHFILDVFLLGFQIKQTYLDGNNSVVQLRLSSGELKLLKSVTYLHSLHKSGL